MSPDDWRVLYDARVTAARSSGVIEAELPRLGRSSTFVLHGLRRFDWRPSHHTWEDEDISDAGTIGRAGLTVTGARWSRDRNAIVILVSDGTIVAQYERMETDEALVDAWRTHWARWCESFEEELHPLLHAALRDAVVPSADALLEAWRAERTSDLASALDVLETPEAAVRLESLDTFDAWAERLASTPASSEVAVASLRELARCAAWTFEIWSDRDTTAEWWRHMTVALGRFDALPDPRCGHALLSTLYSPSDWWFRVDQVAHVVARFEAESDEPSFADHLFRLLEVHADADTSGHALEVRDAILPECDCNGAEMGERLRLFAEQTRARYPEDRPMSRDAHEALRWRLPRT